MSGIPEDVKTREIGKWMSEVVLNGMGRERGRTWRNESDRFQNTETEHDKHMMKSGRKVEVESVLVVVVLLV